MTIDKHTLALISIVGNSLDVLGALYLSYDLLGGEHGPLRTLTRGVTYGALFGAGYGLALSDALIGELLAADLVVIGAPMYNYMISWPLKAWIDQIVRLNKTFGYDENGSKGLLQRRKVVVITSRGGAYRPGTPSAKLDHQEAYLRDILAFIGLSDVTFIHAENQGRAELAGPSRVAALGQIAEVVFGTLAIATDLHS